MKEPENKNIKGQWTKNTLCKHPKMSKIKNLPWALQRIIIFEWSELKCRTILTWWFYIFFMKMTIQKNQRKNFNVFFILSILMDEIYNWNIDIKFIERNDEFLSGFMIVMEWLCNNFSSVWDITRFYWDKFDKNFDSIGMII